MEIPGKAVGMYSDDPSDRGGINWLPTRQNNGIVTARKSTFTRMVNLRWRSAKRKTGRYRRCDNRAAGFADSGRRRPRMNRGIRAGTSVIASKDENATERVFVHRSEERRVGKECRSRCSMNA